MSFLKDTKYTHFIRLSLSALIFLGSIIVNFFNQYILANHLVETDYGIFISSRSLIAISSMITCLGIPYAIVIILSKKQSTQKEIYNLIKKGSLTLFFGTIISIPIVIFYVEKNFHLCNIEESLIIILGILNFGFLKLEEGIFQGLKRSHLASYLNFSIRAIFLGLLIAFLKKINSSRISIFLYVIASLPVSISMFLIIKQITKREPGSEELINPKTTFREMVKLGVTLLVTNSFLTITIQLPIIIAGIISSNLAAFLGIIFAIINTALIFMIFMSNNLMAYTLDNKKKVKTSFFSYERIAKIDLVSPIFTPVVFAINPLLKIFLNVVFPKYIALIEHINLILVLVFIILLQAPTKVILTKTNPSRDLLANTLSFIVLLISLAFWVFVKNGIGEIIVIWSAVFIFNRFVKQILLKQYFPKKFILISNFLLIICLVICYFLF